MSDQSFLVRQLVLTIMLAGGAVYGAELVSNGDFDADVAGWHLVGRGSDAHSNDGADSAGSVEVTGGLAGGATQAIVGQCISSPPAASLSFGASVKVVAGSPSYCRVALFESQGDDCSWIQLGAEVRRTTFSGGWDNLATGVLTLSAATGSIELRLHCANAGDDTGPLQIRFDDVFVSTSGSPGVIFSDDFETGDTTRWSSAVP